MCWGAAAQKGVQVGTTTYDELAKLLLMVVVEDGDLKKAIETIETHARTGNFGDGKIFVSDVKEAYTIRTGKSRL